LLSSLFVQVQSYPEIHMLSTIEKSSPALSHFAPARSIDIPTSLEAQVGNTPLLQLKRIAETAGLPHEVQLFAKAEWFNPSGSVKDRPALNIIKTAERQGHLRPGMTLLDSTSGNMGIAYAMLGAARGYHVKITLPSNAIPERIAILRSYGAELIFTDPLDGSDGAIREVRRLAAEASDDVYYANQYNNPANWQAHYFTTANEIWEQTGCQVTHFIAGLGTSGTFVGTTRRLKELNPYIRCISFQPDSPFNGLEGLKHMETAIKPGIYDAYAADADMSVKTEDAYKMARQLARQEGLFVGISSAAAVSAAVRMARELEKGVVVTILPDNGYKYLSERFWNEL
jgi:cysteine synthase B